MRTKPSRDLRELIATNYISSDISGTVVGMTRPNRPKLFAPAPKCEGKNRYNSEQEAMRVKQEQELLVSDLRLEVYRCTSGCGGWHLTRTKQ